MPFIGEQHIHHAPGVMRENPYDGSEDFHLPDGSSTSAYTGTDRLIAFRSGTSAINGTGGFNRLSPNTYDPTGPTSPFPSPPMVEKIGVLQARLNQQMRSSSIQSWRVVALANEVFGFDGWNSQIMKMKIDSMVIDPETDRINVRSSATIRITLKDGMFHEADGFGQISNAKTRGVAFQKCQKEAVTNAIKRAWMTISHVLDLMPRNNNFYSETEPESLLNDNSSNIGLDVKTEEVNEELQIDLPPIKAEETFRFKTEDPSTPESSIGTSSSQAQTKTIFHQPPESATFNFSSQNPLPSTPTHHSYAPVQRSFLTYDSVRSTGQFPTNLPFSRYQTNAHLNHDDWPNDYNYDTFNRTQDITPIFANNLSHHLELQQPDDIGFEENTHYAVLNNNICPPVMEDEEIMDDFNTHHGPVLASNTVHDGLINSDDDEERIGIRPVLDEEINISFSETGEMITVRENERLAAESEAAAARGDNDSVEGYSQRAVLDEEVTISLSQQGEPIIMKEYERQAILSQNIEYSSDNDFRPSSNSTELNDVIVNNSD